MSHAAMARSLAVAAASCFLLLLLGGAGTADSFLAPAPRTRIRPHRRLSKGARTTSLRAAADWVRGLGQRRPGEAGRQIDRPAGGGGRGDAVGGWRSDAARKCVLVAGTALVLVAAGALAVTLGNDLGIDLQLGQLIRDPSASFDVILRALEAMDPNRGMVYFSSFYLLAEILAIPAVPLLTASSGYLFGLLRGTAACLLSASVAASVSFVIGRTLLRGYVEKALDDNPRFRRMDRAIEREGFRLMLLLRLSPLFPFALSNYLYGASSVRFLPYFFGTLLGFAPGTFAYVYAGRIGKALTIDGAASRPWYVYAGGMAAVAALIKIAGDVASGVINAMEEDREV